MWQLAETSLSAIADKNFFWLAVGSVVVICVVVTAVARILTVRSREHTKRELAAYVAAGSMDSDKAIAILNAGEGGDDEEEDYGCGDGKK